MAGKTARRVTARECALRVVRRVFEQGAYADRAFTGEAVGLEPRERALAMAIAYGSVQRRATLDHFAEKLSSRPLSRLEPAVLAALRVGLFQLMYLDGVADHAAVNETVSLAKRLSRGGGGLVNAVLRRAIAERDALLDDLDDSTAAHAAIMHSVPEWLAARWWEELGPDDARALLVAVNRPAESALRVNTLAASVADVLAALPVPAHAAVDLPEGLVLEAPWDVHGSELWRQGWVMPQSRGSMHVARTLGAQPGERVLDLCAAPGAKTTHVAALMSDEGRITAVERHSGRARALAATCARMHAASVRVEQADAALTRDDGPYDRVLIDPPCSGLGTLQSRPDVRWRVTPQSIQQLVEIQYRILCAGAEATRPGGVLVYSVCTISRAEGPALIERFAARSPAFELEESRQLLPHHEGTDGFFIARMRRARALT